MLSPSLADIWSSKRVRLTLITASVFTLLVVLSHRYDAISTLQQWPPQQNSKSPNAETPAPPPNQQANAVEKTIVNDKDIDWSRFAYVQYVTNSDYLCNSIMLFEILHRLGAKADRAIMYPTSMLDPDTTDSNYGDDARLLFKARDEYGVKLVPIKVQHRSTNDGTWADSFTKLLAFNQTQYDRVLSLDSDSTVLQTMDELFLLPPATVAMPRAYWLYPEKKILSSQMMLVTPSAAEFARVMAQTEHGGGNDYDMEVVNYLYADSALILPHRPYDLLTSEFLDGRRGRHGWYLHGLGAAPEGDKTVLSPDVLDRLEDDWDPVQVLAEAKFLHFSDWPLPKPWLPSPENVRLDREPKCRDPGTEEKPEDKGKECKERDIWNGFYSDFRARREKVCRGHAKVMKNMRRGRQA